MSNYYSRGSSAHAVSPVERQRPDGYSINAPAVRPLGQRYAKPKPITYKDVRERIVYHIVSIALVAVIVAAGVALLAIDINHRSSRVAIQNLQLELNAINHQNDIREVDLALSINLQEIEYIAVNYLNMAAPQEFQIMNIAVPFAQTEYAPPEIAQVSTQAFSFRRLWGMVFGDSHE